MAERSKAADCKSADSVYGGSNPPPPTIRSHFADLAQQVEHIHGKDGVSGSSPEVGSRIQEIRTREKAGFGSLLVCLMLPFGAGNQRDGRVLQDGEGAF